MSKMRKVFNDLYIQYDREQVLKTLGITRANESLIKTRDYATVLLAKKIEMLSEGKHRWRDMIKESERIDFNEFRKKLKKLKGE